MNELIQRAIEIAMNQYGNRGSTEARQLHAAVLLRRASHELAVLVRNRLEPADLQAAIAEAVKAYPTRDEIAEAIGVGP